MAATAGRRWIGGPRAHRWLRSLGGLRAASRDPGRYSLSELLNRGPHPVGRCSFALTGGSVEARALPCVLEVMLTGGPRHAGDSPVSVVPTPVSRCGLGGADARNPLARGATFFLVRSGESGVDVGSGGGEYRDDLGPGGMVAGPVGDDVQQRPGHAARGTKADGGMVGVGVEEAAQVVDVAGVDGACCGLRERVAGGQGAVRVRGWWLGRRAWRGAVSRVRVNRTGLFVRPGRLACVARRPWPARPVCCGPGPRHRAGPRTPCCAAAGCTGRSASAAVSSRRGAPGWVAGRRTTTRTRPGRTAAARSPSCRWTRRATARQRAWWVAEVRTTRVGEWVLVVVPRWPHHQRAGVHVRPGITGRSAASSGCPSWTVGPVGPAPTMRTSAGSLVMISP